MKILIILMVVLLSGCAGQALYEIKPIEKKDGSLTCCEVKINNSKDIDLVEVNFKISEKGAIDLTLKEKGVKTNAAVAAENQGKLLDAVTSIIPKG